jgi:hypothetical protein
MKIYLVILDLGLYLQLSLLLPNYQPINRAVENRDKGDRLFRNTADSMSSTAVRESKSSGLGLNGYLVKC